MNMIRIASALTVFLTAALSLTAATTWDHKVYKLLNVNSGKALDVEGYSLDLGADIQQWTDGGTTNQKWYLMNVGNGTGDNVYQALGNVNSGYALDVRDWSVGNNFNGQAIQQWWKHGYYTVGNEQFQLYHLGSGRFNIISYASGKYLAVDGASTSNGAIIVQYASSGGNEQKWDLYEASHTWSTPSYSPSFWNDDNNITLNNNCYNYANNRRNDSYAQPGVGGGLCGSQVIPKASSKQHAIATNLT